MKPDALDLTGRTLVDMAGSKVGEVVDFYFDAGTNEPEWLVVEAGLLEHRAVPVPLDGIKRDGERIITPYPKDQIMDAPAVDADAIDRETERALYEHFHVRRELPGRTQDRAAFDQDRSETGDFRLRSWKAWTAA
jgi:hypothetical protein